MIFQVPYWDVAQVWPRVSGCVEKALARQSEWRLTDILEQLANQRMQLWVVPWTLAVVTQIQTYPGSRVCMLVLCGGARLHENSELLTEIEQWARSLACDEMRIQGRPGWGRVYPEYEPIATVMRRKL
jgi:hypothetical protein